MNYIYVYSGKLPSYALESINSVLSVDKKARIILCTDQNYNFDLIENISFNEVESELTHKVKSLEYFKNEINPLWNTSLLRIFYLLDVAKKLKLDSFVHFDVDVLIYKPYENLEFLFNKNRFNITSLSELDLIFSYSCTENLKAYESICYKIYNILCNPEYYQKKYYEGKKLNEMMLLNIVFIENNELFNILPTIPNSEKYNSIIFDSITYGQYLSGVHKTVFSRNIIQENSYVGRFLIQSGTKVKFKNKPYLKFDDKKIELANLHIHGKKLKKFLPEGYKCLINY